MEIGQYTRGYYQYSAYGLCRARDPYSNKVFSKFETIRVSSTILVLLSNNKEVIRHIAQSELMLTYSNLIKDRMVKDLVLKKRIGGIRWNVDIIDFVVKVYKNKMM